MTHSHDGYYRLVAIDRNSSRTVMMTGLEFLQAIVAREAISEDCEFAWYRVERDPEAGNANT